MLALLQENQELLLEQVSEETATFDLQKENVVQREMQSVTVESLKNEREELGKTDAEQAEELVLFASEPTKYEGERSEEVRNRQEQKIQEAKEKTQFVEKNIVNPLQERYEKQMKKYWAKNEAEQEQIKIYWSYDYMQDMTNKETETYIIYLTAVNMQYLADGSVTALPWRDICLTVELVEEKDGFIIRKEEARWDYNVFVEFREDGAMVIRRNE